MIMYEIIVTLREENFPWKLKLIKYLIKILYKTSHLIPNDF